MSPPRAASDRSRSRPVASRARPISRSTTCSASGPARARFLEAFASRGLRIAALNCSAWPMHPVVGAAHSALIDKTLRLASELGVSKIVSMSGCPGDGAGATTVNWTWYPWPDDAVALGRRGWDEAVALWTEKSRLAERSGVTRIAFELHPLHIVYNVPTALAFRAEVGDRIGVNLDPSHLFWQQMDPLAAARALGTAVYHVHMKDTEVQADQVALAGVLDNRPFATPEERAWVFRTVGRAHPAAYWSDVRRRPGEVGYDDSLSIEQEDPYASRRTVSARPPGSSPGSSTPARHDRTVSRTLTISPSASRSAWRIASLIGTT